MTKCRDVICAQCDQTFMKINHLTQHIKSVHEQVKDYACFYCDQKFSMKSSLRIHIENIHLDMKNHECEDCHRKFYEKYAFVKHRRIRNCRFCDFSSNCFQLHVDHEAQHSFVCHKCEQLYDKVGPAKEHAKRHNKKHNVKCLVEGCERSFGVMKELINHLIQSHNFLRCFMCAEFFDSIAARNDHLEKYHEANKCYFCEDDATPFKFYDPMCYADHLKDSHKELFVCDNCEEAFKTHEELLGHCCGVKYDEDFLIASQALLKSPELEEIDDKQVASCFTDDHGTINKVIPGWPIQAYCSIDGTQNEQSTSGDSTSISINQNHNVIQNGSSTILTWCIEIKSLLYVVEKIEWMKNSHGNAVMKPKFDRRNLCFKKDAFKLMFKVSCKTLVHPYDLGSLCSCCR